MTKAFNSSEMPSDILRGTKLTHYTVSNKRRGMHKAAQNLPSPKRARSSSDPTQGRMWTRWEDDLLVRGVCVYGNNWDLLCDIVNQKLLRRSLSLRTPRCVLVLKLGATRKENSVCSSDLEFAVLVTRCPCSCSECYDRCTTLDTLKLYPDCWELSCGLRALSHPT